MSYDLNAAMYPTEVWAKQYPAILGLYVDVPGLAVSCFLLAISFIELASNVLD